MKKGGFGGEKTKTGLRFEKETDLLTALNKLGIFEIKKNEIYKNGEKIAKSLKKNELYIFLDMNGIDYREIISCKLLPDDAIFVLKENKIYIIEVKFQETEGSTDEKLQTCDFKIKKYKKLFTPLSIEVEYIYILNDWFKKQKYNDVLKYINSIEGCSYYFNEIPLNKIGL